MISKKLLIFLSSWIIENTEFNQKIEDPKFFKLTENEMSDKACFSSENCRVKAYYVKDSGIFTSTKCSPKKIFVTNPLFCMRWFIIIKKMMIE